MQNQNRACRPGGGWDRRSVLRGLGGAAAAGLVGALAPGALAQEARNQVKMVPGKGVNLSHWFAQTVVGGYPDEHLERFTTREDLELVAATGLGHVRFTVEPAILFNRRRPGELTPSYVRHLDRAIGMMMDAGLKVVLDMHPADSFKEPLADDDAYVEAFGRFWASLAGRYRTMDASRIAFEVINEPRVEDADRWQTVIDRLVGFVREGAPEHTVVACGRRWSGVDDLLLLQPLTHDNVLYTFHMYDPFAFTHQGASWTNEAFAAMRQVPYPSTPENVRRAVQLTEDDRGKQYLEHYGAERWNAQKVRERVGAAAAWGREHGVPLYCGEFGAYKRYAAPDDRARFLRDAVAAFEAYAMSWAMWDYKGGFALLASARDEKPRLDPRVVEALGLQMP